MFHPQSREDDDDNQQDAESKACVVQEVIRLVCSHKVSCIEWQIDGDGIVGMHIVGISVDAVFCYEYIDIKIWICCSIFATIYL